MIEYKDIPKYCDRIDKDKQSTVVLSRYQAWFLRRLTQNRLRRLPGLIRFFDMTSYAVLVICVLICARYLLLLSYFRRHNDSVTDAIAFRNMDNGKVAVTFNPNAQSNEIP